MEHKEHLKALRTSVDVLAMSATPIPRTLEMAVTGIREMSTIQTPRVEIGRMAAQLAIEAGEEKIVDLGFQIVTGQTTKRSSSP